MDSQKKHERKETSSMCPIITFKLMAAKNEIVYLHHYQMRYTYERVYFMTHI